MIKNSDFASLVYISDGNQFADIINRLPSKHVRRCIDGKTTSCSNCVGYCQYKGHPGFLTRKQRQNHNCLNKNCYYYLQKPKANKSVSERLCDNL